MIDIYAENYKAPMKGIREDLNKWNDKTCSLMGRLNSVKMSVLPKLT